MPLVTIQLCKAHHVECCAHAGQVGARRLAAKAAPVAARPHRGQAPCQASIAETLHTEGDRTPVDKVDAHAGRGLNPKPDPTPWSVMVDMGQCAVRVGVVMTPTPAVHWTLTLPLDQR